MTDGVIEFIDRNGVLVGHLGDAFNVASNLLAGGSQKPGSFDGHRSRNPKCG